MKYIFFILPLCFISCVKNDGFFREMPKTYSVDSLTAFEDIFDGLKTTQIGNGDVLKVESSDCYLIPFCGFLTFRNDTIFYSQQTGESLRPFMVLNERRFQKRTIEYEDGRVDEIRYLGLIPEIGSQDSLALFEIIPIKRRQPADATYLKFLGIRDGGIKLVTFGGTSADYSIRISHYPKLVHVTKFR